MLTPSERITLITEIARRLEAKDWPLMDLTLREFGFPTEDEWRGSTNSYIISMTQEATPETLIDLAAHLGFSFNRRSSLTAPFWEPDFFRLFITHLATYRVLATSLKLKLYQYGITGFVAHRDIEPTKEWQNEIEIALSTCDALVALLHPEFHASSWTDQEIGFAMGRDLLIVGIRYGQDPYGFIGKYQALAGGERSEESIAEDLFEILINNKRTSAKMALGLVANFERSGTYREAKNGVSLLERSSDLSPDLLQRLKSASEKNSQIYDAYGVADRVTRLLTRHSAG
jgi:hypothetical protein